ncbi:uncharacterized protein LOC105257664 [Camponotus floridanus]|uniref:uncharacterized protein LOC105257664 n=1 Tax=Camponotus floridanus TaxID=104421 RepID=UPI00059B8EC6|nr:uncharacterized protein LOC105257664 [Camponotus floridanus]
MSPRRTRAGAAKQSAVSTRSKRQKINNENEDAVELIQQTRQSQRREKSFDVKNDFKAEQSIKKELPDAMIMLRRSARKKDSHQKFNLVQAEAEDKFTVQNLNMDTNESIKLLRDRHNKISMTEHIKHNLSQSNTSQDLDSNKTLNKKFQRKTVAIDVKTSPIIVTPKSTPPKLSLTPHRSKKTPKKSPISLGSPKTHSITVSKLLKSPRKLSLLATSEENLNKSDNKSPNKRLEKTKKNDLNNSSMSNKLLTSPVTKSKHKKSDNLKTFVRKFSKSPKIMLKSPKSQKSKLRKLKLLSPAQKVNKKDSLKTSNTITSDTSDLNTTKSKVDTKRSPLSKEKNLSGIKRQLIKALTVSQKEDVLTDPIVLLERLSPERIQNMLAVANKSQSDTSVTTKSPLINRGTKFKVLRTSAGSNISVNQNSNAKLRNNNIEEKLTNRVSPRIKHSTPMQRKDRSTPLLSSTPREENIPSIDINLVPNTSVISTDNIPINTRSRHQSENQSNMSNTIMDKSTTIENISKPSLFDDISDVGQSHTSNVKQDATYDKDYLITPVKELDNKKRNTYELEQPQTLSLRRMIRKRTSKDANLSFKENFKKAKVHFVDGKFDTNNAHKLINKSTESNRSHNINMQSNNIINSVQRSRKIEISKLSRNSLASPFKTRSSPKINIVTPRVQLNRIQVTPQNCTLIEKKSAKKSSTKKVPNFGKIHEQMFAKSESLVDAKKRLEARHLAFTAKKVFPKINAKKEEKRPLPTDTKDGTHNRFGFKLRKNEATHVILKKQPTFSREKQQLETRMTLKGIRTNRRFELQMKARNLNL